MNFHGFLNNLSEEFEESTITVGNTLLWGGELSKSSDESRLHTGLGLKEFTSLGDESVSNDGSAVIEDLEDGLVLSLKVGIFLSLSFSLGTEGLEHSSSVTNSNLVRRLMDLLNP